MMKGEASRRSQRKVGVCSILRGKKKGREKVSLRGKLRLLYRSLVPRIIERGGSTMIFEGERKEAGRGGMNKKNIFLESRETGIKVTMRGGGKE